MDGSAEPQGQEINRVKAALPGLLLDFKTTRHQATTLLTSPATQARHHESLAGLLFSDGS